MRETERRRTRKRASPEEHTDENMLKRNEQTSLTRMKTRCTRVGTQPVRRLEFCSHVQFHRGLRCCCANVVEYEFECE
jgi:hypothetical protein